MMRSIISCIIYFLCIGFSTAQNTTKFYAQTDARKIVEGSYVQVDFTLENGNGQNFKAPNLKGFDILSGPNRSTSMSIINGRSSNEVSYSFSIRPKAVGKIVIGSATINTNKGQLKTDPITIEVVKGNKNKTNTDEELFVIAEISDSITYVGQQLILDLKLYTLLDVRSVNIISEPDFDGFYKEPLRSSRSGFQREILNGKEYYTKYVKRYALFPQQTGTYDIEAIPIELGIATNSTRRSFFFSSSLIPKRVSTAPLEIIVKNTPPTQTNFAGAIGTYKMNATTQRRSITTDDAIIVLMEIVGNGDNKMVLAPQWPSNESLEIYDPNIIDDIVSKSSDQITHRKSFEYLLVPKKPGQYNLDATFTYFDTDSSAYVTLSKRLPTIKVIQGSNKVAVVEEKKEDIISDIYPKTKLSAIQNSSVYWSWWHYLLLASILLGAIGLYFQNWRLIKSGQRDPEIIKRNKAYAVAVSKLEKANNFKSNSNSKGFHEEIVVALKSYITDKYKIQALHINKVDLINQLRDKGIPQESLVKLSNIFVKSDIAIYAPSSSSSMDILYEQAISVISKLESCVL